MHRREYQDGGGDEEDGGRARGPSLSVRESLAAEDGNVAAKVANVTSNVVGKVGNKVSAARRPTMSDTALPTTVGQFFKRRLKYTNDTNVYT